MSRVGDLLTGVAALGRIVKELAGIRVALERLADHAEGKSPPGVETPLNQEPIILRHRDDYAVALEVENRLRSILHRDPTAEEIVRELDMDQGIRPSE